MADKEIGDLTDGGAAQAGDKVHVVRGGNSRGATLGDAAAKNTGTTTGTVAAGDDSRITGAAQKASNLSDLASASTARTNLELGTGATTNITVSTSDPSAGSDGDLWFKVS